MKNIGQMMRRAQEMQEQLQALQNRLGEVEIAGSSGGGMVTATLSGKGEMRAIRIDPALLIPAEREVLEDLIIAAVNDARVKMEARVAEEMAKITGGLALPPGMQLPF